MKRVDKDINKVFYENIAKPLRTRKEFLLLLLETIKLFYVQEIPAVSQGKVSIVIDKMSRVFYQVENKIFSIVFPFGIENIDNQYRIYDISMDVDIDSKLISIMISILVQLELTDISAEEIFDTYCDAVVNEIEREDVDVAWKILFKLLATELGYIRYDYDEEHANSVYHPLNHFDINYSANVTYKVGLKETIEIENMVSFLDIKSECKYLE